MRVALIGLGDAGLAIHLPALVRIRSAQVVAGSDPDAARRAQAATAFGIDVYDDTDRMLQKAQPEVVVVGTPPETHAALCLRALAAGCHVICEKPFASSVAEADRVLAAAVHARRRVAANHEFREMPIFRAVRAYAPPQEVVAAQVWQLMDLPPGSEAGWRGRLRERTLFEAGAHLIDFLVALFGELPVAVQAATSNGGIEGSVGDAVASMTLEFSRGRLAHVIQNRLCKGEAHYFDVRVDTPHVSVRASYGGRFRLSAGLLRRSTPHVRLERGRSGLAWIEHGGARRTIARNPARPIVEATRRLFAAALDAFARDDEPPVSGRTGRDVLAVIAAAYGSAASGCRLALSDLDPQLVSFRMGVSPAGG